ncbi:GPW/gp25 family protein [Gallaecimonas mangrovi]|uniref:GPW/gp25 family protein n=1 Tax=Gallaecimonas mangrovi TaxID=2291597 RepID=UPI000E1FDFE8|nr:GPW/gp25 family protein [Gallaecimonas mangrovi]
MAFLLDRLLAAQEQALGRQSLTEKEQVLRQLNWLVSSREWLAVSKGQYLVDVAMPEPVSMNSQQQVAFYAERLIRLIEHYEPRLTELEVQLQPTGRPLSPFRVQISARLVTQQTPERLFFDSLKP